MAQKYHIDKNGRPAICRATKRPCPLGGADTHFDTMEEAQAYADEQNAKEFGLIGSQRKVKATNEYVNNELYINVGGKPLDIDWYDDYLPTNFEEVADSGEIYQLDLQEYADEIMSGYETLDDEEREKLLEEIEYNDWVASGNEGTVEDYIYGEGFEDYLEYADSVLQIKDGKVEHAYDIITKDEIYSFVDEVYEYNQNKDLNDDLERDYRKAVGF